VEITAEPHVVSNGKPMRLERIGNFRIYRRIEVGSRLRVDGAKAHYRDGVLHVVVSKLSGALETDLSIEG
jgi:HSP20 family protein